VARVAVFSHLPPGGRLAGMVSLGVFVYAVLTLILNRPAAERSLQMIRGSV
jgi:hypothetical protein